MGWRYAYYTLGALVSNGPPVLYPLRVWFCAQLSNGNDR